MRCMKKKKYKICSVCKNFFKVRNSLGCVCNECYPFRHINVRLENLLERVSHGNVEKVLERCTSGDQNSTQ